MKFPTMEEFTKQVIDKLKEETEKADVIADYSWKVRSFIKTVMKKQRQK